jgi:RpiR family carbohydrate utilization transcriptional regulator
LGGHYLDHRCLEDAVALLENAPALEFFGFGASAIAASDAQQKFPLFGAPCGEQSDARQQIMDAAMMRPNA